MVADRIICWRHGQFFQLLEVNPPEVMAPEGFKNAFLNTAMIGQEENGVLWIGMVDSLKNHSHLYIDIQFLFQFSSQSLPWPFRLLQLSSWKFPKKPLGGILLSLGDEDFPLFNNHSCCNNDGLHPVVGCRYDSRSDSYRLIPLPGCGPLSWPGRGHCPLHGSNP